MALSALSPGNMQYKEICNVEGTAAHRPDTNRDELVPVMRPIFTAIKLEQHIYALAQFDENTSETTEARTDIVAETGKFRAMLDIRCFVSKFKCGRRSTRAHEMEKHRRYVTHQNGRRCTNMELSARAIKETRPTRRRDGRHRCRRRSGGSSTAGPGRSSSATAEGCAAEDSSPKGGR